MSLRGLLSPRSSCRDAAGVCSGDKHGTEGDIYPTVSLGRTGHRDTNLHSCFPQVERETESRRLGKVKYHPRSFCLIGGTRCCSAQPAAPAVPQAQRVLWHRAGTSLLGNDPHEAPAAGREGGLSSGWGLGQGVTGNPSVTLTLSFCPAPGTCR